PDAYRCADVGRGPLAATLRPGRGTLGSGPCPHAGVLSLSGLPDRPYLPVHLGPGPWEPLASHDSRPGEAGADRGGLKAAWAAQPAISDGKIEILPNCYTMQVRAVMAKAAKCEVDDQVFE